MGFLWELLDEWIQFDRLRRWGRRHPSRASVYDLGPVAAHLGGGTRLRGSLPTQSEAFGSRDGIEVVAWRELKFLDRRSKGGWWSVIEATLPPSPPIDLELDVDDGRLDIRGAPAAVIEQLLDSAARADLASLECASISTKVSGDRTVLQLAIGRLLASDDFIRPIDIAVRLAGRVPAAFEAADAAIEPKISGAPYREVIDNEDAATAAAARAEEVALVRQQRAELAAARTAKVFGWSLVATMLAILAAVFLL